MKKYIPFVSLLVLPLVFSGCGVVGSIEELGCGFMGGKDQDHCYQDAAKRKESFETCAKIKAETFSALEGPATRDKCYLQVAEQKRDPSGCEKIEGGMISYTQEECVNSIFEKDIATLQENIDAAKDNPELETQVTKEQQELADKMQKFYQLLSDTNKSQYDMQNSAVKNLR
ncbi:MAG: hypothetical protein P1P90_03545 [Patescibacteria group bacterium]|nr:hypothetical protein [Patescibacteria group bacterium]